MEKIFMGLALLAIGCILILFPIIAFASLASGVDQPFRLWLLALAGMAIDIIIIAYRITGHKMNDSNRERRKRIQTVVNVITIVVAVCLIPGAWSISEDGKKANRKKNSYEYNSYDRSYSSYDSGSYGSSGTSRSSYGTDSSSSFSNSQKESSPKRSTTKKNYSYSDSTTNKFKESPYQAYDDGYEAVYEDDDYDTDRYNSDDEYASGVDDAIGDLEEEGEEW